MAKVLISRATDEPSAAEYYQALITGLNELGHAVLAPVEAGNPLPEVILDRIRDADLVLFLLSPGAIQSPFVLREAELAAGYVGDKGHPWILPVAVGGVHFMEVPPPLNRYLIIRAQKPEELMPQVAAVLGRFEGARRAQEQKRQEAGQRIQESADAYIRSSLEALRRREKRYRGWALAWYFTACIVLFAAVVLAAWKAFRFPMTDLNWPAVAQLGLLMVVIIGLLGTLARLCFILGKSHAVEALRNADRIHAIQFGEFYLKAFRDRLQWPEIKEAFQHWNIDTGSAFREQTAADFDPDVWKKIVEVARIIRQG